MYFDKTVLIVTNIVVDGEYEKFIKQEVKYETTTNDNG